MGTFTLTISMDFLSLREATQYTGKSRSTLRRFVSSIAESDKHPDRELIRPTVAEVKKLHAENHPFSWLIQKDLLDREFIKVEDSASNSNEGLNNSNNQTIELLTKTIAMLENELNQKNVQIAEFQERQRETNILLQQTTDKLVLLTDGRTANPASEQVGNSHIQDNENGSKKNDGRNSSGSIWQLLNKPIFRRR